MDYAAHRAVVHDEDLKLVDGPLASKASSLSKDLSDALSTLVSMQDNPDDLYDSLGVSNPDKEAGEARRDQIISAFRTALKLKLDLVLQPFWFRVVMPSPNRQFNPDVMEVEQEDGLLGVPHLPSSAIVDMCTLPAIYAYTSGVTTGSRSPFPMVVTYDSFIREEMQAGVPAELLSKAVVHLKRA